MGCTCIIHTDYVDASYREEVLDTFTRIISEALFTEDKEENHEEGN